MYCQVTVDVRAHSRTHAHTIARAHMCAYVHAYRWENGIRPLHYLMSHVKIYSFAITNTSGVLSLSMSSNSVIRDIDH